VLLQACACTGGFAGASSEPLFRASDQPRVGWSGAETSDAVRFRENPRSGKQRSSSAIFTLESCVGTTIYPFPSVPAYLKSIPNRRRWALFRSPSISTQIASIRITAHYSLSPFLSRCRQILLRPVKVEKYSFAAKHRKYDTLKSSSVQQMVQCWLTQERCLEAMSNGSSTSSSDWADVAASYLFCLQLHRLPRDYRWQPGPLPR